MTNLLLIGVIVGLVLLVETLLLAGTRGKK